MPAIFNAIHNWLTLNSFPKRTTGPSIWRTRWLAYINPPITSRISGDVILYKQQNSESEFFLSVNRFSAFYRKPYHYLQAVQDQHKANHQIVDEEIVTVP